MPLLNDELSLWEIAFRWAGHDPDKFWLRIPLPVRDNVRTLMDAILQGHLFCTTLALEKWDPKSDAPPELFIRHYIDQIYDCIGGGRFDRKLLKWARIERWSMQQWCERRGIPLPEFWFPPGWKLDYLWQDADERSSEPQETDARTNEKPKLPSGDVEYPTTPSPEGAGSPTSSHTSESEDEGRRKLDKRQRARIACQEVATRLWQRQPDASKKSIAASPEVQKVAGGEDWDFAVVEQWLSEIDSRDPSKKRGPKKKT